MKSPALLHSDTYGRSVEGRDLQIYHTPGFQHGGTLIIGGVHGDERATITLVESYIEKLQNGLEGMEPFGKPMPPSLQSLGSVAIIPLANPDSFERYTRYNANGIDLNRNFATGWTEESEEPSGPTPFSEPETQALRNWILQHEPRNIVALHWALAEIDADGLQSNPLAETMWAALNPEEQRPYRLRLWRERSQAPCPGSMGQWCGFGVRYRDASQPAIVTLELPYTPEIARPTELAEDHLQTVHARWAADSSGYIAAIEPGVHAMLAAACRHHS